MKEIDVPFLLLGHLEGRAGKLAGESGEALWLSTQRVPGTFLNTSHTFVPRAVPSELGPAAHRLDEDQRGRVTFPGPHLL